MTPLGNGSDRLGVRRPPCLRPTFRKGGRDPKARGSHDLGVRDHAALRFQTPTRRCAGFWEREARSTISRRGKVRKGRQARELRSVEPLRSDFEIARGRCTSIGNAESRSPAPFSARLRAEATVGVQRSSRPAAVPSPVTGETSFARFLASRITGSVGLGRRVTGLASITRPNPRTASGLIRVGQARPSQGGAGAHRDRPPADGQRGHAPGHETPGKHPSRSHSGSSAGCGAFPQTRAAIGTATAAPKIGAPR